MLLTSSLIASPAKSETINTIDVIDRTTSAFLNCAEWRLIGVCFWLDCGWTGCSIKSSLKVSHYIPDVTIQTYRDGRDPPWRETQILMQLSQSDHDGSLIDIILNSMGSNLDGVDGGGGSENKAASHSNMTFTLTDTYGNPTLPLFDAFIGQFGVSCSSRLRPMFPYYNSNLDSVAWRWGIPESIYPQSLSPVGWELGSTSYNWGPYYPRIGHVNNHDLLKESGLIAFRSAHFVSRRNQAHVYTTIKQSRRGRYYIPPGDLGERSNGKWQMISPRRERSCSYLPRSMSINGNDGRAGYRSADANSVWNLWRPYACCRKRGRFLYEIRF